MIKVLRAGPEDEVEPVGPWSLLSELLLSELLLSELLIFSALLLLLFSALLSSLHYITFALGFGFG